MASQAAASLIYLKPNSLTLFSMSSPARSLLPSQGVVAVRVSSRLWSRRLQHSSLNQFSHSLPKVSLGPPSQRYFSSRNTNPPSSLRFSLSSTKHNVGLRTSQQLGQNGRLQKTFSRGLFGTNLTQKLLATLERSANKAPHNAAVQYPFYQALMVNDMPEIIKERYESGRYATNTDCEGIYIKALEQLGSTGKMLAASEATQGAGALTAEQLQAIGQAAVARTRGTTMASQVRAQSQGTGAKASPLHVIVEDSYGGLIFKWFKYITSAALLIYIFMVIFSFGVDLFSMGRRMGPNATNEAKPQHQTVKFSDVHGCDEAKEELQELVEFLKNPENFSSLGGKLPKGVLLVGPPGTGKTLLARAVAGEAGVPFFFASGSEFDEVYVGVGAKRIRDLFTAARGKAPAIIFIDELDAVGGKRNEKDAAYSKQTLNQLLTELDGFAKDSNVVVIAATNLPKLLDPALTRPGRFDRTVSVTLPDVRGRWAILKHHMRNIRMAQNVDASKIARTTTGMSGADLENLVNQAAVHAGKNKSSEVSMTDLEWAKDKITMGAEKRSMVVQPKDKLVTAYHEAGHALVALYTAGSYPLYKVTIMPRGHALGVTYQIPEMDIVSITKAQMLARIDVAMGGTVAEELIYGTENVTSGASSDLRSATGMAYQMVTAFGMSDKIGHMVMSNRQRLSGDALRMVESEVRKLTSDGYKRAHTLLTERRAELETLAQGLLEYETLTKEEVEALLQGKKINKMKADPKAPLVLPDGGEKQPEWVAPTPAPPPAPPVDVPAPSSSREESS